MALNELNFSEALADALAAESCLTDFTGHGLVDPLTGDPAIKIMEATPDFPATQRYVVFEILQTTPLLRDRPNSGNWVSQVLIYSIAESQYNCKYLTDQLQSIFTDPPLGANRQTWYFNISNDCISNQMTNFESRLRSGRAGQKYEEDMWVGGIEVEFKWASCPCDRVRCDDSEPTTCETEQSDLEYDFPDCCE